MGWAGQLIGEMEDLEVWLCERGYAGFRERLSGLRSGPYAPPAFAASWSIARTIRLTPEQTLRPSKTDDVGS
jgi:hypothetical protein